MSDTLQFVDSWVRGFLSSQRLPWQDGDKLKVCRTLSAFALMLLASAPTRLVDAQSGSATRRPDPVLREQQRQFELQMIEATLERGGVSSVGRKQPLALAQIREDFLRIQVIDRKLREANSGKRTFSLKFIANSVSEIRKRALRLKANLALPETGEMLTKPIIEPVTELDQLRLSLSVLSDSIYDFVANPMFISAKVVDTKLSAKARIDLEEIIELSSELKKSSEKLKAAPRPRL
jgi:hypothetical protein